MSVQRKSQCGQPSTISLDSFVQDVSSTDSPKCVCCYMSLTEPYQEIFDDYGKDLEIQSLLLNCLSLDIQENPNEIQAICDSCIDDLIEIYDLIQKEKDENDERLSKVNMKQEINAENPSQDLNPAENKITLQMKHENDPKDINRSHNPTETVVTFNKSHNTRETETISQQKDENVSRDLDKSYNSTEVETHSEVKDEDIEYLDEYYTSEDDESLEFKGFENNDVEVYSKKSPQNEECNTSPNSFKLHSDNSILTDYDDSDDDHNDNSEEFDFRAYKKTILRSTFDNIIFPADVECHMCLDKMKNHKDLLEHTLSNHCVEDLTYPCSIDSRCEFLSSKEDLSFHFVFKHYDLSTLVTYAQCPECSLRFNNLLTYNKHSCYTKRITSRSIVQCAKCKIVFRSNRRYRFHQQFHLLKHRPMACLLCDINFSIEDDLFDHVMYGHDCDPKMVCKECDKIFTTEENLNIHLSTHKLNKRFKCDQCPKAYYDSQILKEHMTSKHNENGSFECQICGKTLQKKSLLKKHIMSHEVPTEKDVLCCDGCGLVPQDDNEAEVHLMEEHDNADDDTSFEIKSIAVAYVCEYCENAFESIQNMILHRNTHTNNIYICDLCPLTYDSYKALKTHKLTHVNFVDKSKIFPVLRHYVCDIGVCKKSYMHWTSLGSHKRTKHQNKILLSCCDCGGDFQTVASYEQHMKNQHEKNPYICEFCGQEFKSKMAVSVHVARIHNSAERLSCDHCDQQYSGQISLDRHIARDHTEYKCEECSKILKNLKNYNAHKEMVHLKLKRFFCAICPNAYYNRSTLIEHVRTIHEKSLTFQCDQCDYQAIHRNSLRQHQIGHMEESPHKCHICGRNFKRKYPLTLHLKRHNNQREFKCPYPMCIAAYASQGILNSHLKKHETGLLNNRIKRRPIGSVNVSLAPKTSSPNVFIDDDDGLGDITTTDTASPDGHLILKKQRIDHEHQTEGEEEEIIEMEDENYINSENVFYLNPPVIVEKTDSDHDYIIRSDDDKIFGNVIEVEEFEIVENRID